MEGVALFGWECQKFKSCKTLDLADSISLANYCHVQRKQLSDDSWGFFVSGKRERRESTGAGSRPVWHHF